MTAQRYGMGDKFQQIQRKTKDSGLWTSSPALLCLLRNMLFRKNTEQRALVWWYQCQESTWELLTEGHSLNLLISIFYPSLEWNCLNLIICSIRLRWSTEITSGCLKKIVNPIYMSLIVTVTWGCGKGIRHMIVWKSVGQSVWAQVWWEERCHSVEKRPVD